MVDTPGIFAFLSTPVAVGIWCQVELKVMCRQPIWPSWCYDIKSPLWHDFFVGRAKLQAWHKGQILQQRHKSGEEVPRVLAYQCKQGVD